jgi:radical SAM superfamily enzyme YgiQ (UPF0313 family)
MKVALVNPPRPLDLFTREQVELCRNTVVQIGGEVSYPVEFGYLSSLLKREGIEVLLIDAHTRGLSFDEVTDHLKRVGPDLIGIPTEVYPGIRCPIPFYPHAVEMVRKIREAGVDAKISVWGPHGTVFPRQVLHKTGADVVIRGEVEETFIRVALHLGDLASVKGLTWREDSQIRETPDASPVDLEALPLPDYRALNVRSYHHPLFGRKPFFLVMASRGCPYRCTYCAKDLQGRYRERPIEAVIEDLQLLKKEGVFHITFTDETFTLKRERVLQLCREMISQELGFEWTCQTRPELLDDELVEGMAAAGCRWIGVGFESASDAVRKRVKKGTQLEDVHRCIELGKRYGIAINLFLISFLPGETRETLRETLEFIKREKPPLLSTAIATPIPGTELWREGLRTGVLKTGDWEECLRRVGQIGTEFSPEEIREYGKVFTTELSLYGGLIRYKLGEILKRPSISLHYLKRLLFFLTHKVRNRLGGS